MLLVVNPGVLRAAVMWKHANLVENNNDKFLTNEVEDGICLSSFLHVKRYSSFQKLIIVKVITVVL